jgi:hypothetical protein
VTGGRTPNSELWDRARRRDSRRRQLAGAVLRSVGGEPFFVERGRGAWLWTRRETATSTTSCRGAPSWGMPTPWCTRGAAGAASRGTSYGAPTVAEVELAERIVRLVPSIEMVRLVNSGTEATMSALRLARAFTGRERLPQVHRVLPRPRGPLPRRGRERGRDPRAARTRPGCPRRRSGHGDPPLQRPGRGRGPLPREGRRNAASSSSR